jgi:ABC-2 type transport system permease protein
MAPISRMSILAGMAVGGLLATTLRATTTIVIGTVVFAITLNLSDPAMLVVVFFLTMVSLYGMGMMFASLYLLFGREAYHMSNLMSEPVYLVSGFYFPVKALGAFVAAGASVIPITLGLDALRQLFYPSTSGKDGFLPVEIEALVLAGLCVFFLILSKYCLDYMEMLGKRTGRLTLRWQ